VVSIEEKLSSSPNYNASSATIENSGERNTEKKEEAAEEENQIDKSGIVND